jgi:hypothetical protein
VQEWEFDAVFIDADTLKQKGEQVALEQLATRLSNAIIDTVNSRKAAHWELVRMEFASGKVTIRLKRLKR